MELVQTIIADIGFIIGITAALITYVASITLAIAQRHKVKLALIFIVVGCLTLSAQRWLSKTADIEENRLQTEAEKKKKELENFKTKILKEIKVDVSEMKVSVNGISAKLEYASLSSFGHELVDIERGGENRYALEPFRKGHPAEWRNFADWLTKSGDTKSAIPCLSFYVNAGHYYRISLMVAYIMTDATTMNDIKQIIDGGERKWNLFPYVENFFVKYGKRLFDKVNLGDRRIGYALFFDHSEKNLIGYADAMGFARELLIYQKIETNNGSQSKIETLLRHTARGVDAADDLSNTFSSFRKNVINTSETKEIVSQMINNEQSEAIAINKDNMFIIKLDKMIKLATES